MANFVDNKKLYENFKEYRSRDDVKSFLERKAAYNASKKQGNVTGKFPEDPPPLPEAIVRDIMLIAKNYARKGNWRHMFMIDEMIQDAILSCMLYAHNFDPDRNNNPFAYITQCVYNSFLQRVTIEKKEESIKTNLIRKASMGQIDSFVGDTPIGNTTHVKLLSKHLDDIDMLNHENKEGRALFNANKRTSKVKKSPSKPIKDNRLNEFLDE